MKTKVLSVLLPQNPLAVAAARGKCTIATSPFGGSGASLPPACAAATQGAVPTE